MKLKSTTCRKPSAYETICYFVAKTLLGMWELEEQGTPASHLIRLCFPLEDR
jgi:hypothetical protein